MSTESGAVETSLVCDQIECDATTLAGSAWCEKHTNCCPVPFCSINVAEGGPCTVHRCTFQTPDGRRCTLARKHNKAGRNTSLHCVFHLPCSESGCTKPSGLPLENALGALATSPASDCCPPRYCADHACAQKGCPSPRFGGERSRYCLEHGRSCACCAARIPHDKMACQTHLCIEPGCTQPWRLWRSAKEGIPSDEKRCNAHALKCFWKSCKTACAKPNSVCAEHRCRVCPAKRLNKAHGYCNEHKSACRWCHERTDDWYCVKHRCGYQMWEITGRPCQRLSVSGSGPCDYHKKVKAEREALQTLEPQA